MHPIMISTIALTGNDLEFHTRIHTGWRKEEEEEEEEEWENEEDDDETIKSEFLPFRRSGFHAILAISLF